MDGGQRQADISGRLKGGERYSEEERGGELPFTRYEGGQYRGMCPQGNQRSFEGMRGQTPQPLGKPDRTGGLQP
jgi:hypothetical protein